MEHSSAKHCEGYNEDTDKLIDPITCEPIPADMVLEVVSGNVTHYYNIETIALSVLANGNFTDPYTRVPFTTAIRTKVQDYINVMKNEKSAASLAASLEIRQIQRDTTSRVVNSLPDIQGITGIESYKGERGHLACRCIQGPKGDKGDMGAMGRTGMMGLIGPKGDMGRDGIMGMQGPKGDKGDTGPQGGKRNYNRIAPNANENSHLLIVKLVIESEGSNYQDYNNIMITAAGCGYQVIVEKMLALGADDYNRAMSKAAKNNHLDIVEILLTLSRSNQ